ncbi:MAG: hypothetical protein O7E52_28410 [Candidatus Poribacteria bacterium]|nr:hypothetical protein [Candidatus Poribacteria bacterium]
MNIAETSEMFEVLSRVKTWVPEMRIVLARKILETLAPPEVSTPLRRMPLDQVFGLLRTDSPPPDDEQCARIVEDERDTKPEASGGGLGAFFGYDERHGSRDLRR